MNFFSRSTVSSVDHTLALQVSSYSGIFFFFSFSGGGLFGLQLAMLLMDTLVSG